MAPKMKDEPLVNPQNVSTTDRDKVDVLVLLVICLAVWLLTTRPFHIISY